MRITIHSASEPQEIEFETIDDDTVRAVVEPVVEGDADVPGGTVSGLSIVELSITDPDGNDVTIERSQSMHRWYATQILDHYHEERR
jgi:hypothetical protein